jgi:hypothetical protein
MSLKILKPIRFIAIFWLWRNVKKNPDVHGGFTPATWLPPQCDNPREGNNGVIAFSQGRSGGTGTVPSFKAFVLFYFVL